MSTTYNQISAIEVDENSSSCSKEAEAPLEHYEEEETHRMSEVTLGHVKPPFRRTALYSAIAIGCVVASFSLMLWYEKTVGVASSGIHQDLQVSEKSSSELSSPMTAQQIEEFRQKLSPKPLYQDENKVLYPHQFVHLHHMKTAGTSTDKLIQCGMSRLKSLGYTVPYHNLHECSGNSYKRCVSGQDVHCRESVNASAFMSYCAPLRDLDTFNWKNYRQDEAVDTSAEYDHPIHAITVLRHPVARVWSMFRFQTKNCYSCRELKDIYRDIENGNSTLTDLCRAQIMNHQTTNLLTNDGTGKSEDELVELAIEDLNKFFTVVGLTEDMVATREIVGHTFPWLAETYEDSDIKCDLPHANASPTNNHCAPDGTHWDLPAEPDEETAALILKHNQLDLRVYNAALEIFYQQKHALGL